MKIQNKTGLKKTARSSYFSVPVEPSFGVLSDFLAVGTRQFLDCVAGLLLLLFCLQIHSLKTESFPDQNRRAGLVGYPQTIPEKHGSSATLALSLEWKTAISQQKGEKNNSNCAKGVKKWSENQLRMFKKKTAFSFIDFFRPKNGPKIVENVPRVWSKITILTLCWSQKKNTETVLHSPR